MANTNPPPKPRNFENKTRPYPFDFLQIQGAPHDMSEKYFDKLPKFNGISTITIEDHIQVVWY